MHCWSTYIPDMMEWWPLIKISGFKFILFSGSVGQSTSPSINLLSCDAYIN